MQEGMGDDENDPRAWDAFYNDLNLSKELEYKGNYLINGLQKAINENNLNNSISIKGMPCRPIIEIKDYSKNKSINKNVNFKFIKDFADYDLDLIEKLNFTVEVLKILL